jgi:hypothetical protein
MLITLKGDKTHIPRPESAQRTMINYGMYAQRLPMGNIFRCFPSGPASQWKWASKAERMKAYKPMCWKTQVAAKKKTSKKKATGGYSLKQLSKVASMMPEAACMLPEADCEAACEEEDYEVGI